MRALALSRLCGRGAVSGGRGRSDDDRRRRDGGRERAARRVVALVSACGAAKTANRHKHTHSLSGESRVALARTFVRLQVLGARAHSLVGEHV